MEGFDVVNVLLMRFIAREDILGVAKVTFNVVGLPEHFIHDFQLTQAMCCLRRKRTRARTLPTYLNRVARPQACTLYVSHIV